MSALERACGKVSKNANNATISVNRLNSDLGVICDFRKGAADFEGMFLLARGPL